MIVALDVGYHETGTAEVGQCALVGFNDWADEVAAIEIVETIPVTEPYVPGKLYLRELPCLRAGLEAFTKQTDLEPELIVVDGNVRLDPHGKPGLGKILFDELGQTTPVIGVAKNPYEGLDAQQLVRGDSAKPLFVTAAGIDETQATNHIATMGGGFRVPALLRRVDQLSR